MAVGSITAFLVVEFNRITDGILKNTPFNYSYSIGNAPESNPITAGGSVTRSGVMIDADVSATAARGDRIQGEATLTIVDFADLAVDVAFTKIYNLDDRSALADMTWSGIAVNNSPARLAGDARARIRNARIAYRDMRTSIYSLTASVDCLAMESARRAQRSTPVFQSGPAPGRRRTIACAADPLVTGDRRRARLDQPRPANLGDP